MKVSAVLTAMAIRAFMKMKAVVRYKENSCPKLGTRKHDTATYVLSDVNRE